MVERTVAVRPRVVPTTGRLTATVRPNQFRLTLPHLPRLDHTEGMSTTPPRPKLPPAKQRVPLLMAELARIYPDTGTALVHQNPFQLLVATILSAQCTDAQVNKITPALFARFPDRRSDGRRHGEPDHPVREVHRVLPEQSEEHSGRGDGDREGARREGAGVTRRTGELAGVGRKTANVVLGDGFGITGITVDTHVGRLSRRLGLTRHHDPVKVEMALNKIVPQAEWTRFSHRLIFHGRQVCAARKPKCGECTLADLCPRVGVRT